MTSISYASFLQRCAAVVALLAVIGLPTTNAQAEPAWTVFHVATTGSDSDPGSAEKPFATVGKAFEKLKTTQAPVRIAIEPGTYREGGLWIARREFPTLIESTGDEHAVISGSDVWADWTERDGKLVAEWTHDWGEFNLDAGYPRRDHDNFRAAGKRSEMVFVDGQLLWQVMTAEEMEPGTFRIDLEADELIVQLPEGKTADALIEVGMRPNLLTLMHAVDVTLKGLTFQHAVSHTTRTEPFGRYAVCIFGEHVRGMTNAESNPDRNFTERITIDGCKFVFNNRAGLTFANGKDIVIRNTNFDDNGVAGVTANRVLHAKIEDSTLNRNNWRMGYLGHVTGWGPAGTKMLFMKDLHFLRCEVSENYATGLWLDTSVNFVTVEDSKMERNWGTGFYYEHNQGPALLKNSLVRRNGYNDGSRTIRISDGGVLYAESEGLTIEGSRIIENINYQIGSRDRDRPGVCYFTGRRNDGHCRNLVLKDTLLMGSYFGGENAPGFYNPDEHRINTLIARHVHAKEQMFLDGFLATYQGSGNRFYSSVSSRVFSTGPNYGYDRVTIEGWQKLTGQDLDSAWAPGQ
ncbi:MAG: right-handed parallel beta-helix repeat-containing protein [Planctomycetota bacterium]